MSDIKDQAFQKATSILNSLGAKYSITFGDQFLTNIQPTEVTITKVKRTHAAHSGISYIEHYGPILKKMAEDKAFILTFQIPEKYELEKYRSALTATLHHKFGAGKTSTEVNRETREITVLID